MTQYDMRRIITWMQKPDKAYGAKPAQARNAILVDMTTGAVLFEKNADQPMPPASMSKIMTLSLIHI